ncbi:MAG: RsbRD N-terminal domain-containing protein, partial [Janthinobacterium sp.]
MKNNKNDKTGTGQAQQLAGIINDHHTELLDGWMAGLIARLVRRDKIAENELRQQASQLLPLLAGALASGDSFDLEGGAWDDTRQLLAEISQSRVR